MSLTVCGVISVRLDEYCSPTLGGRINDGLENMEELVFSSSLSMEEIEKNFEDFDLFTAIMTGLEEALEYERVMNSAPQL